MQKGTRGRFADSIDSQSDVRRDGLAGPGAAAEWNLDREGREVRGRSRLAETRHPPEEQEEMVLTGRTEIGPSSQDKDGPQRP